MGNEWEFNLKLLLAEEPIDRGCDDECGSGEAHRGAYEQVETGVSHSGH